VVVHIVIVVGVRVVVLKVNVVYVVERRGRYWRLLDWGQGLT